MKALTRRAEKRDLRAEALEMFRVMMLFAKHTGQDDTARTVERFGDMLANDAEWVPWLEKISQAARPLSEDAIRQLADGYNKIVARLIPAPEPIAAVAVTDDWTPPPPQPLICANCGSQFPDPMQFMLYELNGKRYTVEVGVARWHRGDPFGLCSTCTLLLCQQVIDRQGIPLPPTERGLIEEESAERFG